MEVFLSKEEILRKYFCFEEDGEGFIERTNMLKAMEEYASQFTASKGAVSDEEIVYVPISVDEKSQQDGCYMTKWKGVPAFTEKHFENGEWQSRFFDTGLMTHWLKPIKVSELKALSNQGCRWDDSIDNTIWDLIAGLCYGGFLSDRIKFEDAQKQVTKVFKEILQSSMQSSVGGEEEDYKGKFFEVSNILIKLIRLKEIKDKEGKTELYQREQPTAWKFAFDWLQKQNFGIL